MGVEFFKKNYICCILKQSCGFSLYLVNMENHSLIFMY